MHLYCITFVLQTYNLRTEIHVKIFIVTASPLNGAVRGWFILAIGKYLLKAHRKVELKLFKIDTESTV